jgi:hypothetical protein
MTRSRAADSGTSQPGIRCGMALSRTHRRALKVLAKAGPRGVTEAFMLAHGFTAEMLTGLVLAGLATTQPETIRAGGRTIEVGFMRITDAGRRAIEG